MSETSIEPVLERQLSDVLGYQKILTLSVETTISETVRQMLEKKVGAAVIVNGDELKGIFTERDLMSRVVGAGLNPETTGLAQVMTSDVLSVSQTSDVLTAIILMRDHGTRHLLVEDNDQIIGILSVRDLLRLFMEEAMIGKLDTGKLWTGVPF